MSLVNYPPLIEGKLPAFAIDDATSVKINVPYALNKAVSLQDFSKMAIMIKTVTTGTKKLAIDTADCQMQSFGSKQYYASFMFLKEALAGDTSLTTFSPVAGNYYKIQLAFKYGEQQSPWSSVGVIKCTNVPRVFIKNLEPDINNINPNLYVGIYENKDVTEKLYSYTFTIYDENNQIYETSGELIHNGTADENIAGIGVRATMQWTPQKTLPEDKIYRIALTIHTINDYVKDSIAYAVKAATTVDANIPAYLLATPDYDNGRILLSLVKKPEDEKEKPFTGNFVISRYTAKTNTWHEVCRFNMLSQTPSEVGVLWIDYTIEHGEKYIYALQAYNSNQLYSNRIYHVLKNPKTSNQYLDYDEFGNPYYITSDFEDMFLTDGTRQLKIKFNPKVSSYKHTILENKIETLGSQYPFICRSGNVNYREFPISGLLSYLADEKELFLQEIAPKENKMVRSATAAKNGLQSHKEWYYASDGGSKLTSDAFYRERQFKMAVMEWLTNGKPKLFRSPGEGNCIVRLMNTSLTPNDTLGRMLHTFNTTAYEIDEYNFNNLNKYNLLSIPTIDNRAMKFRSVNLHEVSEDGTFAPHHNMYQVYLTNATPGTVYSLTFSESEGSGIETYTIGTTGALYLDINISPLSSITLIEGDYNHTATLHYGYYDQTVPDYFSHISKIKTYDMVNQVIGYNKNSNIITDKLEDMRIKVDNFYSITIAPRKIETIYSNGNNYYQDPSFRVRSTEEWSDLNIYYDATKNIYYDGNPNNNVSLGSKKPTQYFQFNNNYILDLSTGNAYLSSDPLLNVLKPNPQAQEKFISITNGRYQIVGDFGTIYSIKLDNGIYVDLGYAIKEIEYTVEAEASADSALFIAKQNWLELKESPEATQAETDIAYKRYLQELQKAIDDMYQQEDYYVL